jgi:hypothetical protein
MTKMQTLKKASPLLSTLPSNAFKGYTPSGLTMMRHLSNDTIGDSGSAPSDFGSLFSGGGGSQSSPKLSLSPVRNPWEALDPVFYQERARTAFGRECKVGKIRVRTDTGPTSLDTTPNKHLTTAPLVSRSTVKQGNGVGQALLYLSPNKK